MHAAASVHERVGDQRTIALLLARRSAAQLRHLQTYTGEEIQTVFTFSHRLFDLDGKSKINLSNKETAIQQRMQLFVAL